VVTSWRCRCGKWSHARRRPSPHLRAEPLLDGRERVGTQKVRCGPFIRWVAAVDAADVTRPTPANIGEIVREYVWENDPNDGIEVDHGVF
jgi:hypothetical protein